MITTWHGNHFYICDVCGKQNIPKFQRFIVEQEERNHLVAMHKGGPAFVGKGAYVAPSTTPGYL